jgi:hypothetical protein
LAGQLEGFGRDGREDPGLVVEMMGGRAMRYPGSSGDLAQAHSSWTYRFDFGHGGVDERLT